MKKKILGVVSFPAIIGIVSSAVAGYVYYVKVGCVSGTCPLTSNPCLTVLWGAVMGYLIGDMFTSKKQDPVNNEQK